MKPAHWIHTKLGRLLRLKHGYAFPSVGFSDTGTHILVTPGNFFEEGGFRLREKGEKYFSGHIPNEFILDKDDLLVVMTEQTEGLLGSAAFVPESNRYLHNQRLGRIVDLDTTKLAKNYLRLLLNSQPVRRQISISASGTKVRHSSPGKIGEVEVTLPPCPEQEKIAEIIGAWVKTLEKLNLLITAKERRKQGLMQQLLHVAAKKAGHSHTRYRLGEVIERVTRKNTEGSDNVLTISAQDGLINQREYFNRNVAGANLSGYFLLRRGEFAYNRSSSIGFPYGAIKRLDRYETGVVSTLYLCFRIRKPEQMSSDYLAHYFDNGYLNSGLRSIAKEGARAHGLLNVTADEFMDLDVFFPPLSFQTKIAAVLNAADAELRLLRDQRTALDQQKRGLMQQLLTGKKRVTL